MKPLFILGLVIFLHQHSTAQSFYRWEKDNRLSIISGIGLNNYYGELNDSHTFDIGNYNFSLGIQYPLTSTINLRGELMYYRISGSDKNAPEVGGRRQRNLSFRGQNIEFAISSTFNLFKEYVTFAQQRRYNFYLLAGIGFTYINPEAQYEGTWYALRPLRTEGVSYSQMAAVFPVGTGIKYKINKEWDIMMECTYRFTTTDYLDDVSNTYIPKDDLSDPIAVILADRGPEVGEPSREAGTPRGNPELNDGYITVNFKVTYKFGNQRPLKRLREEYMY